jgi:integrase
MARVYKRPECDGWWIDYIDADGKRIREPGGHSKDLAERILRKRIDSVLEEIEFGGTEARLKPITFGEYKQIHLKNYCQAISENCVDEYTYIYKVLPATLDAKLMHRISAEELKGILMSFKGTVTDSRINRYRAVLHCTWAQALNDKRVRENVVTSIGKMKEPKPKKIYAQPQELAKILAVSPLWLREIILLDVLTGLRESALLGLRIENIDLRLGVVYIDKDKDGEKYISLSAQGKALVEHILKKARPKDCPYLFFLPKTTRDEDGMFIKSDFKTVTTESAWSKINVTSGYGLFRLTWNAVRMAAQVPNFQFAYFRHTHASWLALAGADMKAIADQLGHSTVAVTEKHYAHLHKAYRNEQIDRIDTAFAFGTHLAHNDFEVVGAEIENG